MFTKPPDRYIQLVSHSSFNTAFENNTFPYAFGQLTNIRVWVNEQTKGDRLVYSAYNTHKDNWTKPKESPPHSFVFLFQDPVRNFVFDQCLDLGYMTLDQVLFIAANYYTTELQKKRITDYLANSDRQRLMQMNNTPLVWLNELEKAHYDEAHIVDIWGEPNSSIWLPDPIVAQLPEHMMVKKPVGRPVVKKVVDDVLNAKVGDAIPILDIKLVPHVETILRGYKIADTQLKDDVAMYVAQHGKEAALAHFIKEFGEARSLRNANLNQHGTKAYQGYSEFIAIPEHQRPKVNLSAPHSPTNNHSNTIQWWQRSKDGADALYLYLQSMEPIYDQLLAQLKDVS